LLRCTGNGRDLDNHLMALGDWRYRARVTPETQVFADRAELGEPEWYIPGAEAAPYYPDDIRQFLSRASARLLAENRAADAETVTVRVPARYVAEPPRNGGTTNGNGHHSGNGNGNGNAPSPEPVRDPAV
jgi:hypothetical protein